MRNSVTLRRMGRLGNMIGGWLLSMLFQESAGNRVNGQTKRWRYYRVTSLITARLVHDRSHWIPVMESFVQRSCLQPGLHVLTKKRNPIDENCGHSEIHRFTLAIILNAILKCWDVIYISLFMLWWQSW